MKKVLATGLLAICLIAASQQQASAWTNTRFSIGLNWEHSSGGNCFAWGAWKNGQLPGPEALPSFPASPPESFRYFGQAPVDSHDQPMYAQQPSPNYATPYQFANYPRTTYYYYPTPAYYYYAR